MTALLCSVAASAHDFEVGGIFYNVTSKTFSKVEVTYKGNSYYSYEEYSGDVVIPSSVSYNGKNYSVTSIGEGAFYDCSGLTSVTIPNSVTSIEIQAFFNCSGLTSITIPASVTDIGYYAFQGCSSLTSIIVESGNKVYDSRENCNAIIETATNTLLVGCKNSVIPNSATSIGNLAFFDCSGLTSVTIPNSITNIGELAFYNCSGLTSVTIPNSVTSIGIQAFEDCSSLTSIIVESNNEVYDNRDNCNAIIETATNTLLVGCKNSVIPNSVTSIGELAFQSYDGLTSVTIPNSVTSIGRQAFFNCSDLASITIPASVTSIGNSAFSNCSGLTSIVVEIGNSVYDSRENCNAIIETATNTLLVGCKNSVIPNSATSIGDIAFRGCSGLTSVTIPNSVTSIGEGAFYDCSGLTSVTIPNSVTSIDRWAFYGCSGIKTIRCTNPQPPKVGIGNFTSSQYQNIVLCAPKGSLAAYQVADVWKEFWEIEEFDATGIENIEDDSPAFEITASGILLSNAEGEAVAIYSTNGALIEKIDAYSGEEIALDKGVYIIRVGGKSVKVKVKL